MSWLLRSGIHTLQSHNSRKTDCSFCKNLYAASMRSRNFIRLRPYRTVLVSELSRKSLWKTGDVFLKYLKANLHMKERERDGIWTFKPEQKKTVTDVLFQRSWNIDWWYSLNQGLYLTLSMPRKDDQFSSQLPTDTLPY